MFVLAYICRQWARSIDESKVAGIVSEMTMCMKCLKENVGSPGGKELGWRGRS